MKNIKEKLIWVMEDKKDPTKVEIDSDEKIKNFFNKLEFLSLEPEEKWEVAQKIKNDVWTDKLYWLETFLAAGIASLGLLQDSVAVIIWAMLIAPLLRPINGLAYSVATGESGLFKKSLIVLFFSVFFSIFIWWFIAYILSLNIETSWILARINPTILDLFVAGLSAMVAILSLKFSRLWESVAWVAMAASLMPPLAVVGIEIAFWNLNSAFGAFMLFLTNLVAIVLVWVILFWMYGFNPHKKEQNKKVLKRLSFVILTLVIISIPLFHALQSIKKQKIILNELKTYISSALKTKIQNFKIENIKVKNIDKKNLVVDVSLKLPENVKFYKTFKKELIENISKKLNKNVKLNIELIRMANIVSKVNPKPDPKKDLSYFVDNLFNDSKDFQLVNYDIQENSKNNYIIKIVWVVLDNTKTEKQIKENYEKIIKNTFSNMKLSFIWVLLPKYEEKTIVKKQINPIDELYKKVYYQWELFLNQILFDKLYFDHLEIKFKTNQKKEKYDIKDISSMNVNFDLYIPSNISTWQLEVIYNQIKKFNWNFLGSKLHIKEFKYNVVDF